MRQDIAEYLTNKLVNNPIILGLNVFMYLGYFLIYFITRSIIKMKKEDAQVTSYELISAGSCLFLGLSGIGIWFLDYGNIMSVKENIYSNNDAIIDFVVVPMFFYQVWNTCCCLLIEKYRTFPNLLHHVTTATCSIVCMTPLHLYYITYFFGLSEVSSVPLCFVLILQQLKIEGGFVKTLCEALFGLTFFTFRIFYFLYVMKDFWHDCWSVYQKSLSSNVEHMGGIWTLFIISVIITLFQFYFAQKIISSLMGGDSKEKKV
jgi:hypothetical protein